MKGNHCDCISNQPETMFEESRQHLMFHDFCWLKRATGNIVMNSSLALYFRWDLQNTRESWSSKLILTHLLRRHFLQWHRLQYRQKSPGFHHILAKRGHKAEVSPSVTLSRPLDRHRSSGFLGKTSFSHSHLSVRTDIPPEKLSLMLRNFDSKNIG